MKDDPEKYYNLNCYAKTNCLHCQDCLAFAMSHYFKLLELQEKPDTRLRFTVIKFVNSTVAAENMPCKHALSTGELKEYLSMLMERKAKLPICHHEFTV